MFLDCLQQVVGAPPVTGARAGRERGVETDKVLASTEVCSSYLEEQSTAQVVKNKGAKSRKLGKNGLRTYFSPYFDLTPLPL